ncbi:phosphatase and actin regulator 2 [Trichonephila clavipes]|nr:phosphatase and actin regulator 2 [Trichonephila clavipes]
MRSTKEELIKKGVLMPDGTDKDQDSKINDSVHQNHIPQINGFGPESGMSETEKQRNSPSSLSVPSFLYVSDSSLVSMEKKRNKYRCGQRTVRLAVVESVVESSSNGISQRNKARSLRAQAQLIQCETKTLSIEKKTGERDGGARAGVPVVTSWKSNCRIATFFLINFC